MATNDNPIKYSDLVSPDSSITDLIKQLEALDAQFTETLTNIKKQAKEVTLSLGNVSGATEAGRKAIRNASSETDALAKAEQRLLEAQSANARHLEVLRKATREQQRDTRLQIKLNQSAEGSYNRLSAQYEINKRRLNAMASKVRLNTKYGQELEEETRKIYEQMKRLQEATGKFQLNVGNYENAITSAIGVNSQFGRSLIALGKGGAEGAMGLEALKTSVIAFSRASLALLTNPVFLAIAGVGAVAGAFKWWYDYNVGLQEATRLTREFLGLQGTQLKDVRDTIQSIADTYGKEYLDVLRVVDTLTTHYGISAENSLTLIAQGFQAGADLGGTFLSQLTQFAPTFRDAGISAEQLVAMIAQTRSGIFSEQGMQLVEMASKRLREMSTATASSLDAIGISSQQVAKDLADGTKSTFDVIQEISARIKTLPRDSQQVGEVLKDVFGRQGAQGGIALVEALSGIKTEIKDVIAVTGAYGQAMENLRQQEKAINSLTSEIFESSSKGWETMKQDVQWFLNDAYIGILKTLSFLKNGLAEIWQFVHNIFGETQQEQNRVYVKHRTFYKQVKRERAQVTGGTDKGGSTIKSLRDENAKIEKEQEAQYKRELTIFRNYQDAQIAVIQDENERKHRTIEVQYEREIADLQHRLDTEKNLTAEQRQQITDTIVLKDRERQMALDKFSAERLAKEKAEREKTIDAEVKKNLALFDEQQKFDKSEFDLLKSTEAEKTKFKLRQEQERLKKILEINATAGKKLSDLEIQTIKNTIARIDKEIADVDKKQPTDLYSVFGINLDEDKKSAISTSVSFAMEQVNAYTQALVDSANKAVEASQREVDAKQNMLQAELEARSAGYASNVALAQKELENAKKNQEQALRQQERAQKAQLAVQSIEQASNLISASALIWRQLGFPWAIPAIGVMWGSFATAKIKAMQATKNVTYGEGGVELLQGGSHQSGNDIDFGTRADGTPRRAEGGEFFAVINKRNSRKFRDLIPSVINSLNDGTFAQKYATAYNGNSVINVQHTTDIRELNDNVRAIKQQGERKTYTDSRGNLVMAYKNRQRTILR